MPGVKITFDVSDGINSLQDLNQKILELANSLKLTNDQKDQLLNWQANKWAQSSVNFGVNNQDTSSGKNSSTAKPDESQKQSQDPNTQIADDIKKKFGDAYADAAILGSNYVSNERANLDKVTDYMRDKGADEETIRLYSAQKWDDVSKKLIDNRINRESDFTGFLSDKLSEEYGLYKTAAGRDSDLWNDYYKSIKTMSDSWVKDINTGLSSVVFDSLKGNTEKAHQDWKNLLSSMNQDLIRAGLGMGEAWASANIFKPVLGSVMGVNQSQDDHSYGALGKDGVSQVSQSVSSYGEIGLLGGPMGAPFLLSRFPANNGLIGLLTGQTSDVSNTSNYSTSELAMAA
jgi:hypothetical protein